MSLDTTLAKAAASAAAEKWQWHYKACHRCHPAAKMRRHDLLCPEGVRLHDDVRETAAEARRQAELDKQPNPAQDALFDLPGQT